MKKLILLTLLFAACSTPSGPNNSTQSKPGNVWREIKPDTGTLTLTSTLATLTDRGGTSSTSNITVTMDSFYYFTLNKNEVYAYSLILSGDTLHGDVTVHDYAGAFLETTNALFVR